MIGNKFDVSAYCQQSLVDAIGHLSSIKFALFILIRPALKIAARSLFVEHETITISNLLSHLNTDTPIASAPPNAEPQRLKRSFLKRLIYLFTIGIPLAIFVGTLVGICHFLKVVSNDISIIFTVSTRLYTMSQQDMKFYKGNLWILLSKYSNSFLL